MNLYETIKATKLGGSTVDKELEDMPPLSFEANGEPLLDWRINGANGGVGDRTDNLFDKNNTIIYNAYIGVDGTWRLSADSRSIKIPVSGNTRYTLSINSGNNAVFRIYETNNGSLVPASDSSVTLRQIVRDTTIKDYTFTTSADTEIIVFQGSATAFTEWFDSLMLNTGDTAAVYEPYGYKISITCGGETNTIYLDESLGTSDNISMTDTGISILTVDGSNTLSVGTVVQPSSVYIKYKEGGDEMVTLVKIGGRYNTALLEIRGLSTDTKPTTEIEGMIVTNGSTYIEIDTGDTYMFDAENGVWHNITG